ATAPWRVVFGALAEKFRKGEPRHFRIFGEGAEDSTRGRARTPESIMQKRNLVLFDIDGTLLTSGGAGEKALRLALKSRFGHEDDLAEIEIAGRTDSGITRQILAKHN